MGRNSLQLAAEARGLNAMPRLDRDRVFQLKQEALRTIWEAEREREKGRKGRKWRREARGGEEQFAAFRREQGPPLERYATFCVLAEKFGPDWRKWPDEYRRPDNAAVARFAAEHAARWVIMPGCNGCWIGS